MVTETSEDLKLMLDLGESWPELQHLEFRFFQKTPGDSDPRGFFAREKLRYSRSFVFFFFTSIAN